ncbi:MAG: hypothetical protein EOM23_07220 [Candidatus Moranbacteria bacterium]|nr:hypothetical protein [Candidatus Moranbacteria bacterium]
MKQRIKNNSEKYITRSKLASSQNEKHQCGCSDTKNSKKYILKDNGYAFFEKTKKNTIEEQSDSTH